MERTNATRKPLELPLSGVILGRLVKAFRLDEPDVGGERAEVFAEKSIQRCFAGDRPTDKTRSTLLEAVVGAAIHAGLLPARDEYVVDGKPLPLGERLPEAFRAGLTDLANRWDALVGGIAAETAPVTHVGLATMSVLRLVTIDVALRWAGLLWLQGVREIAADAPCWTRANGAGLYLARLIADAKVSRPELAGKMRGSPTSLADWLDGRHRPSEMYVLRLAAELGSELNIAPSALARQIRCTLAASTLADELAEVVGREGVGTLGLALTTCASFVLTYYRQLPFQPTTVRFAAVTSLTWGTDAHAPPNHELLVALAKKEPAPRWRTDLRWASFGPDGWLRRVQHCLKHIGGFDDAVVELAADKGCSSEEATRAALAAMESTLTDDGDLPAEVRRFEEEEAARDPKFAARRWEVLATEAATRGDKRLAIACWRNAVTLDPTNAEYHFFLGAVLGEADEFEEALTECWLAIQFRRDWDRPWAEVGALLARSQRHAEAVEHLEGAERVLSTFSPHVSFVLGRARMKEDPVGALAAFERTLAVEPRHASALEAASLCAVVLGEDLKGRRYAKEAARFGKTITHDAYRKGELKRPKTKKSKPR